MKLNRLNQRTIIGHNKKVINALVQGEIFIEGPYTTSAGVKIAIAGYIERIFSKPKEFRIIIHELTKVLKSIRADVILGCPMVGIPFADAAAYELKIASCPIRKTQSDHGVITQLVGTVPDNCKNIVLFDDWNGGWDSLKKYYNLLKIYSIKPKYVVSIVESYENPVFREGIEKFLQDEDLIFISLCTYRDLIEGYLALDIINKDIHDIMAAFLVDPESYAKDESIINHFYELQSQGKTNNLKPKTQVEKLFEIR